MRVLEGRWAGRKLNSPGGKVRPTSEELRALWLDLFADRLQDARVIDLFAGTGAVGIEAVSRGARSCDFVENGAAALHSLKANVAALRMGKSARIFKRDAIQFVARIDKPAYVIAFADPPYGSRQLDRLIGDWMKQPFSQVLSVEHPLDHPLEHQGRTSRLGDSGITSFFLKGRRG